MKDFAEEKLENGSGQQEGVEDLRRRSVTSAQESAEDSRGRSLARRASTLPRDTSIDSASSPEPRALMKSFDISDEEAKKVKEFSEKLGITSKHLLKILSTANEYGYNIIFRPVNPDTKRNYYLFQGAGKGTNVKLKSANYGPLKGLVPYDFLLSKSADPSFLEEQLKVDAEITKYHAKRSEIEESLKGGNNDKIQQLKQELEDEVFLDKVNYKVKVDGQEFDLKCARDGMKRPIKDDEGKPIYFYEKAGKKFFYQGEAFEDGNFEYIYREDANLEAKINGKEIKDVKILAYKTITINRDNQIVEDERPIIPDYDLFTFSPNYTTSEIEEEYLTKTLSSLTTSKTLKYGIMSEGEDILINSLRSFRAGKNMIKHGGENNNNNPEPINNDPDKEDLFSFFIPQSLASDVKFDERDSDIDFLKTDGMGILGYAKNLSGVEKLMTKLRQAGNEIKIGPRWGFTFDRATEKVSYNEGKRDIWRGLYSEESSNLEALQKNITIIASNYDKFLTPAQISSLRIGDNSFSNDDRKEQFLSTLKTIFDPKDELVKKLLNPEYFDKVEFDFTASTSDFVADNAKRVIKQSLDSLDIIHQYERIIGLQISPKFTPSQGAIGDQQQQYEVLLGEKIESFKKNLSHKITQHLVETSTSSKSNHKFKGLVQDLGIDISSPSTSPRGVDLGGVGKKLEEEKVMQ